MGTRTSFYLVSALALLVVPACVSEPVDAPETATASSELSFFDEVVDASRAAIDQYPLTQHQEDLLAIALERYDALSPASRAAADAFLAERDALDIPPTEIESRWQEFQTAKHADFDEFANEYGIALGAQRIASAAKDGLGTSQQALFGITVLAVIGCGASIAACLSDVTEAFDDCLVQVCPDGTELDTQCCLDKADDDDLNCALTCGANTQDGDYGNCCRRKKKTVFEGQELDQ